MHSDKRGFGFYILAAFFGLFVLFLYGPLSAILILSFQGPNGGLTFPLNGVSLRWFANLFEQQAVGDFGGSFRRSAMLGLMPSWTALAQVACHWAGMAVFYTLIASISLLCVLALARQYTRSQQLEMA